MALTEPGGGIKEIRFHSMSESEIREWGFRHMLDKIPVVCREKDQEIYQLKRKLKIWKLKAKKRKWQIRTMRSQ